MNVLLLNLAIADITVVVFFASRFTLIHAYNHPDGKVGTILCKLLTGGTFGWIGSCASVFTMVAIAIERYYAVIRPLGNRATFTRDSLKVRFLVSKITIHLIPQSQPIDYSFVCMSTSTLCFVNKYKKKNFEVKMRQSGLINMPTNNLLAAIWE